MTDPLDPKLWDFFKPVLSFLAPLAPVLAIFVGVVKAVQFCCKFDTEIKVINTKMENSDKKLDEIYQKVHAANTKENGVLNAAMDEIRAMSQRSDEQHQKFHEFFKDIPDLKAQVLLLMSQNKKAQT